MGHDCFPPAAMVGVEEIRPMSFVTKISLIYIDIGGVFLQFVRCCVTLIPLTVDTLKKISCTIYNNIIISVAG